MDCRDITHTLRCLLHHEILYKLFPNSKGKNTYLFREACPDLLQIIKPRFLQPTKTEREKSVRRGGVGALREETSTIATSSCMFVCHVSSESVRNSLKLRSDMSQGESQALSQTALSEIRVVQYMHIERQKEKSTVKETPPPQKKAAKRKIG